MDLYLLRHGDAAKGVLPAGTGDNSLTESAKKEIATVARSIKTLDPQISVVLTSPLRHAVQTSRIFAKILGMKDGISVCNELAPEGSRDRLSERLHHYPLDSTILVVGHEPYLSDLVYEIIFSKNRHNGIKRKRTFVARKPSRTEELSRSIILKKAGLAKIRLISLTPTITGEIRWLMTPRILKRLQGAHSSTTK